MNGLMELDVIVVGEILVELSATEAMGDGSPLRLGVSGDALNVAAAAAAAGARTGLLTRVADDGLGDMILEKVVALGVAPGLIRRVRGQQGAYFVHADPEGNREFVYIRGGSAATGLEPADVVEAGVDTASVVVGSGVTAAISPSANAALEECSRRAKYFVYDPNFRPRLTSAEQAAEVLRRLAPHANLVTPSASTETEAVVGVSDAAEAVRALRSLGAAAVAVTRGGDGVLLDDGHQAHDVRAVAPPATIDQTGAGDSLVGTAAARIALGDSLLDAVRLGSAAASLSIGGQGGTGLVPSLSETRRHLLEHGAERAS